MENAVSEMKCPLCGAPSARHYEKGHFWIHRCASCKLLFVENPPVSTEAIYDEGYFIGGNAYGGYSNCDAEKKAMHDTLEKCLELLEKSGTKGTLLDVGAATGYFVELAKARGWNAEGIDISEAAVRIAKEKNRKVISGTLDTISYPEASFDSVTFFDVLEHVSDSRAFIAHIARILKPGGTLMLSTPDAGSAYARIMGKHWHLVCPPEHLVLFNRANLKLLLKQGGFDVIWIGRLPKRFTLPYIFQTASRWLGLSFLSHIGAWLVRTPFSRFSIPLDLRDNVFVLARRVVP